jgi:hypothetical protein
MPDCAAEPRVRAWPTTPVRSEPALTGGGVAEERLSSFSFE